MEVSQIVKCPECGSDRVFKDGLRYPREGSPIQRFLCRDCGFRFSEHSNKRQVKLNVLPKQSKRLHPTLDLHDGGVIGCNFFVEESSQSRAFKVAEDIGFHNLTSVGKQLNNLPYKYSNHQVCAIKPKGAKNLSTATENVNVAVGEEKTTSEAKGKIVEFLWQLKRNGRTEKTITNNQQCLTTLLEKGANLFDQNSIKDVIAQQESWTIGTKSTIAYCYKGFAKYFKIPFEMPRYKYTKKLPYIPTQQEIDLLIGHCGKKVSTMLQLLKETGMRLGEALRLKWMDVNDQNSTITVNDPEKNSNPRMFKVSSTLIAMLKRLPQKSDKVFGNVKETTLEGNYLKQRKTAARKLQNPRLLQIKFHTLRHFKATMEYAKTKDILHVMKVLGHKAIQNTLIYTQLIDFREDEYHSATAKTVEEAQKLIETGFEYVTKIDDVMLFRKRK